MSKVFIVQSCEACPNKGPYYAVSGDGRAVPNCKASVVDGSNRDCGTEGIPEWCPLPDAN